MIIKAGREVMHMADALVSPAVATAMFAASGLATAYSVKKIKLEDVNKKIPLMGVMGAFVFAAQMINFSIPGTGSSGHLCGGLLLSALLGPYAGFLTMVVILAIQCLLFADGGLMALGCNIFNMAFYACFFGYICLYKPIVTKKMNKITITVASVIASVIGLQLGAFSVVLETSISDISSLPFGTFVGLMQPIHLAIGAVEGLVTAAVLIFLYQTRPELITDRATENRFSLRKTVAVLAITTVCIAGGLSLLASSNPDGLEWSIGKTTGSEEVEAEGGAYDKSASIQNTTALIPDYAIGDSALGSSAAGVIGILVVCGVTVAIFQGIRKVRSHKE